jgi:hypothetical protein
VCIRVFPWTIMAALPRRGGDRLYGVLAVICWPVGAPV